MRAYKGVISIAPNSQSQTQRESYRERARDGGGVGGRGGEVSDKTFSPLEQGKFLVAIGILLELGAGWGWGRGKGFTLCI